jgi:hypothetical protein
VPKSSGNVPGPVEIEDDSTLLHPTSGPALVEGVKRNQMKYFLAFRTGKSDVNFCFNLNEWGYVLKHLSRKQMSSFTF